MNKKHIIAIFALVIALVLPISLIAITLASDTVVKTAESALSYEGVAAKAVKQPGVRSLWRVNNDKVKALEEKGYDVYYGSIMAAKKDAAPNCEALTVVYDAETNTVSADASLGKVGVVTVYDPFGNGSNKFVTETEESSVFAFTTLFDFDDNALFDTELVYAGWLVTVSDSGEVDYYYDYPVGSALASRLPTYEKNNELYYTSFTLSAVCDYFVNEYRDESGEDVYNDNQIMNVVVDENRALRYDDLSVGFASGKSTHVGTGINLVSGIDNTYLFRAVVTEEGYYSLRIRYALADADKSVRFYLRSRLDGTAVSTFASETSVAAEAGNGGYTVPAEADYAEEKLYIYLTAGEHILDLWTESETTAAVSSLILRCDRVKSDLSINLGIKGYEVRTNGYEVVEKISNVFYLRGYLAEGSKITTDNPTRMGYAEMKGGSYFDYTVTVGTPGAYEIIGDLGIAEGSALHIYDITGMGLETGMPFTPDESLRPIFTADKATVGGADSRVTEFLGSVSLKAGVRTLRVYVEGSVSFRQLFIEKNGVSYLTVNYVDENGTVVAPQKLFVLDRYAKYDIPVPAVLGYRPNMDTVSGILVADKTVTVVYTVDNTASERTVTFVYGLNGEYSETVTVPVGAEITAPDASVNGYYLTWYDSYGTPVYNFATLGDGTVLTASYNKSVSFTVSSSEMQNGTNASVLESDPSLWKITHDSDYFGTGTVSYLTIPVSVEYAGIYEIRVKGVSDGYFDLSARVDGTKYVYNNHVRNDYFVRDVLAMTKSEKLGAYTSDVQLWIYLPEGEHTVDLTIKGGDSSGGKKEATALAVYAAEFTLLSGMHEKGDVLIQQNRSGLSNGSGNSSTGGIDFTATGWIEYSLTVPKDGYYDVYYFVGNQFASSVTASVDGVSIGSATAKFSNSYRGAEPVAFRAALTKGTHTFRISADDSIRTHILGVVAAWSAEFVYQNVTFVYGLNGESSVTDTVARGLMATPPTAATIDGYILEWLDESGAVVTDFTVTGDATYTARYTDVEADVTFVYGDESKTVIGIIGETVTPPEEANKTGYIVEWLDETGKKVTDFTVTGDATYTARYVDYTRPEVFATEMTPKGTCTVYEDDTSILLLKNNASNSYVPLNYVTLPVTVYKSGVYKILMRGKASSSFDFSLSGANNLKYAEHWNASNSPITIDKTMTDYTMTDAEKTAEYVDCAQTIYIYLEEGTSYDLKLCVRLAGEQSNTAGALALYSVLFELMMQPDAYDMTSESTSTGKANTAYSGAGQFFGGHLDYALTLEAGKYNLTTFLGTNKATAVTFTLYATNDTAFANPVATKTVPSAAYGGYKAGSMPATATVTLDKGGDYIVRVSTSETFSDYHSNCFGVFAEKIRPYEITFVYDGETTTVYGYTGDTVTPPKAAEKEGYVIKWLDRDGNKITDFTVTGNATYTAEYIDYTKVEVFATEMTPHGKAAFLESDPSILVLQNNGGYTAGNAYVTFPVTIYKSGIYKFGMRGKADTYFDFVIDGADTSLHTTQVQYIDHWNNTTGAVYVSSTDYTMTNTEKTAAYKYGTTTSYVYLEEGSYTISFFTKQGGTDSTGAVGIYSFLFSLVAEPTAIDVIYNEINSDSPTYNNDSKGIKITSANEYVEYSLTLSAGTYNIAGLVGTNSAATYTYTVIDANGNVVKGLTTPRATYSSSYRGGSVPAVATDTVTITEDGTYTVRVSLATSYYANNIFGVYAEKLPEYDVTFVYGEETKTVSVTVGGNVTPPEEANKAGYIIEWLDENGNVVTDLTALAINANRTFTANYVSENEVNIVVRGVSPSGTVLIPEMKRVVTTKNTPYTIGLAEIDGYTLSTNLISGTTGNQNLLYIDVVVYRNSLSVSAEDLKSSNTSDAIITGGEDTLDTFVVTKDATVSFSVEADIVGVYAVEMRWVGYALSNKELDLRVWNTSDTSRATRWRNYGKNASEALTREDCVVATSTAYRTVAYIRLVKGINKICIKQTNGLGYIGIADIRLTPVAPEWDKNGVALNYKDFTLTGAVNNLEEVISLTSTDHYGTAQIKIGASGYYDIRSIMGTSAAATLSVDLTKGGTTQTFSYTTTGTYKIASASNWDRCATETLIAHKVYLEEGTYTVKIYGQNFSGRISVADLRIISSPDESAGLSSAEIAEYNEFLNGEYTVTNEKMPTFVGKWQEVSINGKTHMASITSGSAFYFMTDGATSVRINFTDRTNHTSTQDGVTYDQTPYFAYTIDGGAPIRQKITDPVITLPNSEKHVVRVVMDCIYQYQTGRWSQGIGFAVHSVSADGRAFGIQPTGKIIHFYGDSITEGIMSLSTTGKYPVETAASSSVNSYSWYASEILGAVRYNAGYGGTGILNTGSTQPFGTTLAYDWKDKPVDKTKNIPDVIVINHGTNDGADDSFSATLLENLRTIHAMYPNAKIVYVIPIWQAHAADIRATVAAFNEELTTAGDTNTVSIIETAGWLTKAADTKDSLHPHAEGAEKYGTYLAEALKDLLGDDYF